jgi:aminopeptidase N
VIALLATLVLASLGQASAGGQEPRAPALRPPTRADILRGEYGRYRANNDLLSYHLDIRVDPEKKHLSGRNVVRFRMLKDDTRIQLDLYADLTVERILHSGRELKYDLHRLSTAAALRP